jgi:hypothetical protein
MRLRCAVPKTPAKSSVPLGSPLNKLRSLLTRSESTLPQTLVPLDFISFNSNVYRKSGEGHSVPAQKFVNSSLAVRRSCVHARTPTTPFRSYIYFITRGHPGVGYLWGGTANPGCLSASRRAIGQRRSAYRRPRSTVTEHGPRLPLVRQYRCAQTRKVPESRQLLKTPPPGNISALDGV